MISLICGIYDTSERICNVFAKQTKKKSHVIQSMTPWAWPAQTGPTARLLYLLQISDAGGGGAALRWIALCLRQ